MLIDEVKQELFPKRAIFIDEKPPSEVASLPEPAKKKWVDEKVPTLRNKSKEQDRFDKLDRSFDNLDKYAWQKSKAKPQSRSKTLPVVKRDERGKAMSVSFDRFKLGQAFFKQLQKEPKQHNYQSFIQEYTSSWNPDKKTDELDSSQLRQAVVSFHFHQIEGTKQTVADYFNKKLADNQKALKAKQARRKLGSSSLRPDSEGDQDLVLNLRGIKTSTEVAEQYVENLFECLLQNEGEFLDSLATPLAENPL